MPFLYVVVALVLIFDFLNGFHDSANSIATVVSTKVLSPLVAVILAAFFNFIAFTVFPVKSCTYDWQRSGESGCLNMTVICLRSCCCNNMESGNMVVGTSFKFITHSCWRTCWCCFSSCRNIISNFFRIAQNRCIHFYCTNSGNGIIIPISHHLLSFFSGNSHLQMLTRYSEGFRLLSSSTLSLGHGGNDAQKSMGIIWAALIVSGLATKNDPIALWIILVMPDCNCPGYTFRRMEDC